MRRWDGPKEAKEEKLTLKKRENLRLWGGIAAKR